MKDKPKILTILAGVGTILLGIFTCVVSVFILVDLVSGSNPWLMLATFGMLLVFQIILFLFALGIGITIIVIGSLEVRFGTLSNYEYSRGLSSLVGYSVFDAILIILSIVGIIFTAGSSFTIPFIILVAMSAISFIFKMIDYGIFKKKINKGLISVEKSQAKIDLSKLNLSSLNKETDITTELEKIKSLKDKNLITDEEYENLRKKIVNNISKKKK